MTARVGYVLSALLLGVSALVGSQFSSATFTDESTTGTQVTAARDWTAPTVSVDDPGFVLTGVVTVSATASDEETSVASVEIQYRLEGDAWGTLCVDTSSPWECTWDTTTVADGPYQLRATATDEDGNVETSSVRSTEVLNARDVVIDPVPSPVRGTITLTARMVNAWFGSSTITFQGTVSGTNNWVNLSGCTNLSGPEASCSFDTTAVGSGVFDLRVVATSLWMTYEDTQTGIVVDNTNPTVSLTVPSGTLGGTVGLTATASDNLAGVASVTFETRTSGVGSSWVTCGTDTEAPFGCDLDTTTLADGTQELRATATDGAGNATTTAVQTRQVDNTGPNLSFTPPSGTLTGTVNLTATASDTSGMASVAFQYQLDGSGDWVTCGGAPDTTSPYACTLDTMTLLNGSYLFRAVATDNAGTTTTSATGAATVYNVSVDLATPPAVVNGTGTQLSATWYGPGTPSVVFERALVGSTNYTTICTVTATPVAACSWTSLPADGNYNVRARVSSGGSWTDTHTVVVDQTAPSLGAISVPAAPLNGTVQLTATATDARSGVATVLFEYKRSSSSAWSTCGSDTTSPYSCALDTTTLDDADYAFRATATDVAGNVLVGAPTTRAVNSAVSTVSISSPTAGATVQGVITVAAEATSTKAITKVTLQYLPPGGGWTTICEPQNAPYSCQWNASALARGSYQLRAVLTQANGYTVTSSAVSITVERLRGSDVQATSGNNTGLPGAGDTITLTYLGLADLSTIQPGFDGSTTGITVRMTDERVGGGPVAGRDYMTFGTAALGQVAFSLDYVRRDRVVTFGNATMAATTQTVGGVSYTVVTITLNAPTAEGNRLTDRDNAGQVMQWNPSATVKDANDISCETTAVTESGGLDADL